MHWGKFAQAEKDLEEQMYRAPGRVSAPIAATCVAALAMLRRAQRFYFPDGRNVLTNRVYDRSLAITLNLPYDVVAVLSRTVIRNHAVPAWKISLASRLDASNLELCKATGLAEIPSPYAVMSLVHAHIDGVGQKWMVWPIRSAFVGLDPEGRPILKSPEELPGSGQPLGDVEDLRDDAVAVMNLCAMLNLSNVKVASEVAPPKLQKKRESRGRGHLPTYHVLVVDGERWDSEPATGQGGGVRSHLRRGHIRRLADERLIWVRATVVKGSIDGFVHKDYDASKLNDR